MSRTEPFSPAEHQLLNHYYEWRAPVPALHSAGGQTGDTVVQEIGMLILAGSVSAGGRVLGNTRICWSSSALPLVCRGRWGRKAPFNTIYCTQNREGEKILILTPTFLLFKSTAFGPLLGSNYLSMKYC